MTCLYIAKEDRQLYTLNPLNPITTTEATSPTPNSSATSAAKPLQETHNSGPVRTQRMTTTARMRTGPLPAALKARVLGCISDQAAKANKTPANTAITPLTEAEDTESTESAEWTLIDVDDAPASNQPPASSQPEDTLADVTDISAAGDLDVQMDGTLPSGTDETIVGEGWVIPVTIPTGASCDTIIKLQHNPTLGVHSLIQTSPPAFLSVDEDERPQWLITSIKDFLRHMPYYLCLNKVVDLFLAQEARLGYPAKARIIFSLSSLADCMNHYSPFISLYPLETGPTKLPCS